MSDFTYKLLKFTAILGVVAWLGFEFYRHFSGMAPGDISYIDGNSLFNDGRYGRAAEFYKTALTKNPVHLPALRALANSQVQLKRYDQALSTINQAIGLKPDFAGHYVTRGIIQDHLGRYEKAMKDYKRALRDDPETAKGMHWLDRLLYNVQKTPPTIKDRLNYLKAQMALPAQERVLSNPELDGGQRPYEQ